jgi:hypothetical protein
MNGKKQTYGLWIGTILLLAWVLSLASPVKPAQAQQSASVTTYAAYQTFERGFMIWRADSGEILAFDGVTNAVYRFPEATYDHLPDNPVQDAPPAGLVKPIRGFGRVWGNFAQVRAQLGWGTNSEIGYTATAAVALGYPGWEQITRPDGAAVRFLHEHWSFASDPGGAPQPEIRATNGAVQEFEHGLMIYAVDTGSIWVLTDDGNAHTFRTYEYGHLPENPVWDAPPPGYVKPILGFGKVWGNFPNLRNNLGWAVAHEDSYIMQLSHNANYSWVTIQLPDGQWVEIMTDGSWRYR